MTHINRSAILPYSDKKMFALVNDVTAYPEYLDGCVASTVISHTASEMIATLFLQKHGIKMQFTTVNQLDEPKSIELSLKEGPFDQLKGRWFFQHLQEDACKVILDLDFSLSSRLASVATRKLFDGVSHKMVDCMVKRARELYG